MSKINLNEIQITNGRNVLYCGCSLDKCGISGLIREVALATGYSNFPLWSDIYWYSTTKKELVTFLNEFLNKLR